MTKRLIQIGDEIVSETKLFDWCLRHIDGTKEVTEARTDPEVRRPLAEDIVTRSHTAVKPATPTPRRPPARFSPEVIDFE